MRERKTKEERPGEGSSAPPRRCHLEALTTVPSALPATINAASPGSSRPFDFLEPPLRGLHPWEGASLEHPGQGFSRLPAKGRTGTRQEGGHREKPLASGRSASPECSLCAEPERPMETVQPQEKRPLRWARRWACSQHALVDPRPGSTGSVHPTPDMQKWVRRFDTAPEATRPASGRQW